MPLRRIHRLIDPEINEYCEQCSSTEPSATRIIADATKDLPGSHMLVGKVVGTLLQILVATRKARNILEVGTYTGYSASLIASALPPDGILITIEENPDMYWIAKHNLRSHPNISQIQLVNGEGLSWLEMNAETKFDLIFLDCRKEAYVQHEDLLYRSLSPGGLLVIDNALARGKVLSPIDEWVKTTDFMNRRLGKDGRFLTSLLPIRDGLLLAYKLDDKKTS